MIVINLALDVFVVAEVVEVGGVGGGCCVDDEDVLDVNCCHREWLCSQ